MQTDGLKKLTHMEAFIIVIKQRKPQQTLIDLRFCFRLQHIKQLSFRNPL